MTKLPSAIAKMTPFLIAFTSNIMLILCAPIPVMPREVCMQTRALLISLEKQVDLTQGLIYQI